ncbi:glycoside hydrolase 15 protein [Teratosphaeriaceae sp. CCFEE 6253]|nr:glycoside hydrolase 15 protein [Teratosphaeriaceae sp. CCFEE 6253]
MKLSSAIPLLASITAVAAEQWTITHLSSQAPTDDRFAATNAYSIEADVSSSSGCGIYNAYCSTRWASPDDAPYDQWIQCAHNSSDPEDRTSDFAIQLYPEFAIGDFSIGLQQNYTDCAGTTYTADSAEPLHVTNTTSTYTCNIDTASSGGNCSTPSNSTGFEVSVGKSNPLNSPAPVVLSFPVLQRTVWGDNIFVSGNISELGNWDPYNAAGLSSSEYTDENNLWTGAFVISSAGAFINNIIVDSETTFEWKFIEWLANGTLVWECGENRVFTVVDDRTNQAIVGANPDVFRCGNH